jgi:uncharacterized repeat protein (TIGR03843 family)
VDHGVSFHVDDKLRTVLWGWARDPLDDEDAEDVRGFVDRLSSSGAELAALLAGLLTPREVHATLVRCERLLRRRVMPAPTGGRPSIPWPAF